MMNFLKLEVSLKQGEKDFISSQKALREGKEENIN